MKENIKIQQLEKDFQDYEKSLGLYLTNTLNV